MQAYIKRADAINTILEAMTNGETNMEEIFNTALRKAASRIETIPPEDVVPVVRCKDCKYRGKYPIDSCDSVKCVLHSSPQYLVECENNWYCADGEPKHNGGVTNDGVYQT